jgi:hypothetical protein
MKQLALVAVLSLVILLSLHLPTMRGPGAGCSDAERRQRDL